MEESGVLENVQGPYRAFDDDYGAYGGDVYFILLHFQVDGRKTIFELNDSRHSPTLFCSFVNSIFDLLVPFSNMLTLSLPSGLHVRDSCDVSERLVMARTIKTFYLQVFSVTTLVRDFRCVRNVDGTI